MLQPQVTLFPRICGIVVSLSFSLPGDICDQSCLSSLGTEAVIMKLFLGEMGQLP